MSETTAVEPTETTAPTETPASTSSVSRETGSSRRETRSGAAVSDLEHEGEVLQFTGIPSFAPEHLQTVRPEDPLRAKHLGKALEQLAEEGVARVFRPLIGTDCACHFGNDAFDRCVLREVFVELNTHAVTQMNIGHPCLIDPHHHLTVTVGLNPQEGHSRRSEIARIAEPLGHQSCKWCA